MNIGITGGRGFIGSHIATSLKRMRGANIFLFDKPGEDILNKKSVEKFVKGKDLIIHAAAVNRGTDEEVVRGSIEGTLNLISAVSRLKKKSKIIFLSSIQAETDTLYGISKKFCESMLTHASRTHKIPVSIFRLTNVFGEGSRPFYNTAVATFCYQVAQGEKLKVNKEGVPLMLVYIDNVVRVISEEVFKKRKESFYFKKVYTKNIVSVPALAKLIESFKDVKNIKKIKSKFHKDLYKTYLSFVHGK
ncbi:MAG: NAD-dependent epimerase/dehydratase family protein [Candidatus Woesearchaeota archaeon]